MGDRERQWVSDMYPGPKWKKRVKQMPDEQVVAIYLRDKADPKPKRTKKSKPKDDSDDITLF